jgi:uncharacterized RDD family membrane protein YckC
MIGSHWENKCTIHSEKMALSACHCCGEFFCEECLNEGTEYYYCNKPECYEEFLKEEPKDEIFPRYSDMFSRFIAFVADAIIILILNSLLAFLLNITPIPGTRLNNIGIFILFFHPYFIIPDFLYYVLMESSSKQATLGKLSQDLVVTTLDGKRITFGQAFIRNFIKAFSILLLYIGVIIAFFTQRKQTLHDLAAETLVMRTK